MSKTKFITTTALMIALTVVLQFLTTQLPLGAARQFVTGSAVNACLIIATALLGVWGGIAVGVVTPFVALALALAVPFFTPFIALGNATIVVLYHFLKTNRIGALIAPAVAKFAVLYASINIMLRVMALPDKQASAMLLAFGWPQLVTALIGGIIAMALLPALQKAFRK